MVYNENWETCSENDSIDFECKEVYETDDSVLGCSK